MNNLSSKQFQGLYDLRDAAQHFYDWHRRRLLAKIRHLNYKRKWRGSFTEPNSLLEVDINNIQYKLIGLGPINTVGTHILDGDWNQKLAPSNLLFPNIQVESPQLLPISQWTYYTSSDKHFNQEVPWEKTELHTYFVNKYKDEKIIDKKLGEFEQVYHQLRTQGYKTQQELMQEKKVNSYESRSLPGHDEICVAIGPHGEIYHCAKGNHRMAISKVLNIETVPVRVLIRHKDWQKKRYEIYSQEGKKYENLSHPDLISLLD